MKNKFMQEAIKMAEINGESNYLKGGPFGAIIVRNKAIIGKGRNQVLQNNDPTCHAEIMAIRDACKNSESHDLSGCEIYTSCFPCPMCLSAIIWANIKTIYYGNTKEDAADIGFRDDHIYKIIKEMDQNNEMEIKLIQIDRKETIKEFNKFNNSDKLLY